MKTLLACLLLAAAVLPAHAQQQGSGVAAERARIETERQQVDARFTAQEVACYRTFAVNDCLKAARAQRRERLSDLRRQELSLNDAERKRRAAEKLLSIEERNADRKQEETAAQRAEAATRRQDRQDELARRSAERARSHASAPERAARAQKEPGRRQAASGAAKEQRVHDSAAALQKSQQRQQEAKERAERVAKRQAEAARSAVKPLPVPP